jgi:hypothetical protein
MNIKTLLAAVALTALPAMSMAMCSGKQHQAMSCAEGTVWDSATSTCTQQISS